MSPLNTEEWARKTEGGEARGVRGLPACGATCGACGNILQFTVDKKTGNSAVAPRDTEF